MPDSVETLERLVPIEITSGPSKIDGGAIPLSGRRPICFPFGEELYGIRVKTGGMGSPGRSAGCAGERFARGCFPLVRMTVWGGAQAITRIPYYRVTTWPSRSSGTAIVVRLFPELHLASSPHSSSPCLRPRRELPSIMWNLFFRLPITGNRRQMRNLPEDGRLPGMA